MQVPIFNRYERKYILSGEQKDALITFLRQYLVDDPYSVNGAHYTIYNIYFDTPDFQIIRNSIQKPVYKDKLRLRSYQSPLSDSDFVYMEIKKKYEGQINKRRITMTYKEAMDYLNHDIRPNCLTYLDQQVMNEIDYFIKIHRARPGTFLRYDRIALMSPSDPLRITFDHNIVFRNKDIALDETSGVHVLTDQDHWLMEVKSESNFPLWLVRKLSDYQLYSRSFSKYGKAYQIHLSGATNDDYILDHY
ncbi:MAG: polyphosphate polymerase domain-containing protein [Acholeplasmataceae bacterium]|nr:polyphosphate polymerase domain-containing protein [Acholeplasmataceae bacterium]